AGAGASSRRDATVALTSAAGDGTLAERRAPDCVTQQRALRASAIGASEGCSLHLATRKGQRSWNRQPTVRLSGSGGAPSIVSNRLLSDISRSMRGTALIRAQV